MTLDFAWLVLVPMALAFAFGWIGAWAVARARHRQAEETSERRISNLTDRADRLAGEKVVLLGKLERHGENLAAIKQQLLARERTLYAITGTWPAMPGAKSRTRDAVETTK